MIEQFASTDVAGSDRADQLSLPVTTPTPAVESGAAASGTSRAFTPAPHPVLQFTVYGTPMPQGSHKAFVVNGHAKITEDNKNSRPWRQELTHAAIAALGDQPQMTGPVEVHVTFVMPRPQYHFRTGRHADVLRDNAPTFPSGKPDCDKLMRNLGDALTASAVIRDDAQIAVWQATKIYAEPGSRPGAHVFVMAATS